MAYGVPKIHRPNCPLWLIVPSVNIPLYPLATFLHNILVNNLPKADNYIENSFQLVDTLNGTRIDKNSIYFNTWKLLNVFLLMHKRTITQFRTMYMSCDSRILRKTLEIVFFFSITIINVMAQRVYKQLF